MTESNSTEQHWVYLVTCPIEGTCRWFEDKANAEDFKAFLDTDCKPEHHFIERVHVVDAMVIEEFWDSEPPRERESSSEFIERIYQQAQDKIDTAMRNGEIARDWRLLDEIAEPLVDLWLLVLYTGGKAKRYSTKRKREDNVYDTFDRVMETLNSEGKVLLWTEEARPALVYQQGIAAIELDRSSVVD